MPSLFSPNSFVRSFQPVQVSTLVEMAKINHCTSHFSHRPTIRRSYLLIYTQISRRLSYMYKRVPYVVWNCFYATLLDVPYSFIQPYTIRPHTQKLENPLYKFIGTNYACSYIQEINGRAAPYDRMDDSTFRGGCKPCCKLGRNLPLWTKYTVKSLRYNNACQILVEFTHLSVTRDPPNSLKANFIFVSRPDVVQSTWAETSGNKVRMHPNIILSREGRADYWGQC